jgi:hypothetical protein
MNPKIVVKHIGRKFFDYSIYIPRDNTATPEYRIINGTSCEGREIEIPIIKVDEAAFEKAMDKLNNSL